MRIEKEGDFIRIKEHLELYKTIQRLFPIEKLYQLIRSDKSYIRFEYDKKFRSEAIKELNNIFGNAFVDEVLSRLEKINQ
jgi:hypothetical protein